MFNTLAVFKAHMKVNALQVYISIKVIQAHVFWIYDKKNLLEKEQRDYTAANNQLQLDNDKLMSKNARLHAKVATLRTRMTLCMTSPISLIYEMPGSKSQAFSPHLYFPKEKKSVKIKDSPAFNRTNHDVHNWIKKMR